MSAEDLKDFMDAIRSGRINGCLGCVAWEIAMEYQQNCEPIFEQAMLELMENENPEAQYPAYLILCRCQDKLSPEAIERINIYKAESHHRRVLKEAYKQYGILPDPIR